MLVCKEIAGFQKTILSFSPIANLEVSLLTPVISDSLVQKNLGMW